MSRKLTIDIDEKDYQDLMQEWKKIKESKFIDCLDCTTIENFIVSILQSYLVNNKFTKNIKEGNVASLIDQLKELFPSGDLTSFFDLAAKVNRTSTNNNKKVKDNEKYKS